jgi:hypothetical protein
MSALDLPADQLSRAATLFGRAWLALAGALAIHVADEALTDFLSVYNPTVRKIRARFPWILLPTFTFRIWIAGLAIGIALMFLFSPVALRGPRWIVLVAVVLSLLMVANGLLHIVSSLVKRRFMPGVYSSPILIAAATLLLVYALRLL